jgi:hypothetical protein
MGMTLQGLRDSTRKALGVDSTDLVDADVDLYLNRSYWEVMDKFPFREKERAGVFPTVAGVRNYKIPTPVEAVYEVSVVDPITLRHIPLDQMMARETEFHYNENTSKQGRPIKYLLENCYIRFWPTPDKVYNIYLRKKTILQDIQNTGIEIPQVWNDIVIYGAGWRASIDYRDWTLVNNLKGLQRELMASTEPRPIKELASDMQHAGVVVTRRDY